jgi:hypothetical protein
MAVQFTAYPIKTAGGTATVKTAIDPANPNTPPRIVDKNNNTLYEWNATNKKFEPLGSQSDVLPSGSGFGTTETYGSLLTQNSDTFTKNTTTVINKLPEDQKKAIQNSNSFSPYNAYVNQQAQASGTGTSVGEETVSKEELTAAAESANKLIDDQSLKDGNIRKQYGNWRYPINFPDNQDRITFKMFRYNPKTLAVGEDLGVFKDRKKPTGKEIFGSVTLPINPSITDVNTVNWGSDELNGIAALAAATSYSAITGGAEGAAKSIDAIVSGLKSGSGALKTAAAAYFAGEAAGVNKNFLSRVTGAVLNPNMELLFNGPQLRTHSFSFTLSAREEKESQEIRKIIRFFKQGMSVKRASTNLFLKAPNIFDISYHYRSNDEDHPWLNQIKTCALTSCQVNYTPAGNYATYYDGSMTSYELTLSFSELDPIFEDDYKNDGDTSIGY